MFLSVKFLRVLSCAVVALGASANARKGAVDGNGMNLRGGGGIYRNLGLEVVPTVAPTSSDSAVPSILSTEISSEAPTIMSTGVPTEDEPSTLLPLSTEVPTLTDVSSPPEIVAVTGSFCTPTDPCPVCYGDCDEDSDCEGDLICEERDGGEPVSGCSGGEESTSNTDYCVNPNAMRESTTEAVISTDVPSTNATTVEPEITTVAPDTTTAESETTAEEPEITVAESETTSIETDSLNLETSIPSLSPADIPAPAPKVVAVSATFCTPTDPCPMCYGDCDEDSDCEGDLICEERDEGDPVSGCSGGEESTSLTDYCVDPNVARADTSPTASTTISAMPSSVTTEISTDTPTSISTDTPTFVSTEMPSEESATLSLSTEVPSVVTTEIDTDMPTTESTSVDDLPALSYSNFCSPTSPCDKCVGDCNLDSDCVGELVCKNREGGEPIVGCSGTDSSRTDFCVDF